MQGHHRLWFLRAPVPSPVPSDTGFSLGKRRSSQRKEGNGRRSGLREIWEGPEGQLQPRIQRGCGPHLGAPGLAREGVWSSLHGQVCRVLVLVEREKPFGTLWQALCRPEMTCVPGQSGANRVPSGR